MTSTWCSRSPSPPCRSPSCCSSRTWAPCWCCARWSSAWSRCRGRRSAGSSAWSAAPRCVAVVAVQTGLLKDYQLDRFRAFYDPTADPKGVGYNVRQAQIAIGSGGVDGQGLFHGAQTQGQFVPAQQTDFIFTVAGEELGFLGAAVIVALIGLVLWRAGRIAMQAEDLFGRLVATGILCWFAFQSFENIGMTLGIMPVTGVPLPFVSYGGSSMFANMLAVGLLQNVHMRRYA